jgi:hypothetical protein
VAGAELPSLPEQRDLILDAAASHDAVLVEGAGGVTVNLGTAFGLLDIAGQVREAGLPVTWILVARAGLGTLNHSSLTVRAIQHHGFAVHGIVIGSWPAEPGPAELYNRDDLVACTGVPVLGALPEGASVLRPSDFQTHAPGWINIKARTTPMAATPCQRHDGLGSGIDETPELPSKLSKDYAASAMYRLRTQQAGFELRLVPVGELRHDRGCTARCPVGGRALRGAAGPCRCSRSRQAAPGSVGASVLALTAMYLSAMTWLAMRA